MAKKRNSPRSKTQTRPMPGLFKMAEPGGPLLPGKVSELIIEFAQPLMDLEAPRDLDALRHLMDFAVLCWNLPILERSSDAAIHAELHHLDQLPEPLRQVAEQLRRDRVTRFSQVPFLLTAEVRGTSLGDTVIRAEAREAPRRETKVH